MDPKVKAQEVRGQVKTTFSEVPQCDLTFSARISVVADGNLALFQLFFCLGTYFFDFASFLGATPQMWEKTIRYSKRKFYVAHLKKIYKKSPRTKKLTRP